MNPNQKDDFRKRKQSHKAEQSNSSESEEEQQDQNDHYESDFIVDDEDEDEGYGDSYHRKYSDDDSYQKKSKKQKKKDKKKKKSKKRKQQEESYDEDDLDLIDNDQKLTRLKKKKARVSSDEDEDRDVYGNSQEVDMEEDNQSEDQIGYHERQEDSNPLDEIHEIMTSGKPIIFDPADIKLHTIEQEDREAAEIDLPQRYIQQLKIYMKSSKKSLSQVRQMLQNEQKRQQAQWIYHKIKSTGLLEPFDEKDSKDRIRKVLEFIHREHLQIMYIYFYRKKMLNIGQEGFNLQILWKIHEYDEQWFTFHEKQKKQIDFLEIFLPSFGDFANKQIVQFARQCTDVKMLKYLEDYSLFAEARCKTNSIHNEKNFAKRLKKLSFVAQIAERGIANELQNAQIFLSPRDLCFNLKSRNQERRPRTPHTDPKTQFEKIMRNTVNQHHDMSQFPLLAPDLIFKTITKYLCYELFAYPELRKLLKQKYFKKLIISTQPTKKGSQDIDLYSIYFPVKRIKDKHISTIKREVWILAQSAQKLDLITIDIRFEWQLPYADKTQREHKERDTVYLQLARSYFEISNSKSNDIWNIFRKRILHGLLNDHFLPSFHLEIKDDLTRQGEKQIINACCQKFKQQLNKGPSLKQGKPIRILSMVLEDTKLGIAFIDESGKAQFTFHIVISNDEELRRFVGDQNLALYIREYKPDMILIAANCKRAQTLRKELRDPKLFPQSIFCAFGQYEVPRLIAKKQIIKGYVEQQAVLEAISMARLKKNPMSEIISLWSDKLAQNGVLAMNLHPYQNFVNQAKLRDQLQRAIIEVVNLVGLDINQIRKNQHLQSQLEFVSGLGSKKSYILIEKLKQQQLQILSRHRIEQLMESPIVTKNCCPFLRVQSSFHKNIFERNVAQKDKKTQPVKEYEFINLLDLTRIPDEWYPYILKKMNDFLSVKPITLTQIRQKKQFAKLSDQNIILLDLFKNPEKIRGIQWKFKQNPHFDDELVKAQIMHRFRNPREPQRVLENREIFYSLLRQTPQTLKRYMIMQVKVLSTKKNYLNVIIPQNGLFGYIKLQRKTPEQEQKYQKMYQKGMTIKAVIIGFPFDQKNFRDQAPTEEQELLKIQMALDFPHKDNDRHDGPKHDCMISCFPAIVKQIHPLIDLEKQRFELRKQDRPVIQVKQQKAIKNLKTDFRRIAHPKYKNISAAPAIDMMKTSQVGDFVIRPSSQGNMYLTITWNFYKGVIVHIKVRCEQKGTSTMNVTYRIQDKDNRSYNSIQQIIQKCIKPMNGYVQDITSNKKFLNLPLDQIQNQVKRETISDNSHIYYYFGVSEQFPQFVLLIYMYKDKRPTRELIKVKNSGFYFHDQQFTTTRDLIAWFKEHLKEKEYQKYVKSVTQNHFKKRND